MLVSYLSSLAEWSSGSSSLEPSGMILLAVGSLLLFLTVFQNPSLAFSVTMWEYPTLFQLIPFLLKQPVLVLLFLLFAARNPDWYEVRHQEWLQEMELQINGVVEGLGLVVWLIWSWRYEKSSCIGMKLWHTITFSGKSASISSVNF